jgi:chromosome segregation ATPase
MSTRFLYESILPRTQLRELMMTADKMLDENEALKKENEALKREKKDLEIQCQDLRRIGSTLKDELSNKTKEFAAAVKIAGRHIKPLMLDSDSDLEKRIVAAARAVPTEYYVAMPSPATSDEETSFDRGDDSVGVSAARKTIPNNTTSSPDKKRKLN